MHRLVCLGLSHRTAPVELRERIGALGPGAERCPAVLEHAVLQTCYRVELYARLDLRRRGCARRARRRALDRARRRRASCSSTISTSTRARTSPATSVGSQPGSTRSSSARRRSSVRSATRSSRPARTGPSGRGSRCSSARRSRRAAARGRRRRSAPIRRRRARWRSRSPRACSATCATSSVLVVGAGRIGLQTLKAAQGAEIARVAVANRTHGARARDRRDRVRRVSASASTSSRTALAEADVVDHRDVVRDAGRLRGCRFGCDGTPCRAPARRRRPRGPG